MDDMDDARREAVRVLVGWPTNQLGRDMIDVGDGTVASGDGPAVVDVTVVGAEHRTAIGLALVGR